MWRIAFKKLGVFGTSALMTLTAVLVSDLMAWAFETLVLGAMEPWTLVEASLIPLLLTPSLSYGCLYLLAKLERTEQELRLLSSRDALTQAYNRRYVLEQAEAELGRVKKHHCGFFAVLLLDIDFFKQVNDTYGHLAGDAVLRAVCEVLNRQVRVADVIGRYGGEEFMALLPDTDKAQALEVAERLRASLAAMRVAFGAVEIGVTVSIGVACGSGETPAIDVVLAEADRLLYQAKHEGRNRVAA